MLRTSPATEQLIRRAALFISLVAVLALPFALTARYSSLSQRDIATSLSFPEGADTRFFLTVMAIAILVVLSVSTCTVVTPRPLKRFSVVSLLGLLAFGVANLISLFVRGGGSVIAWGFPFQVGSIGSSSPNVINASSMDYNALWMDIAVAVVASALAGATQLPVVRSMGRAKRAAAMFSLVFVAYVGTFSFWWLTSKTMSQVQAGKRLRQVEMHQASIMYLTQPMWEPAFWFLEHVCGYRYTGYVAAMDESAFYFEK